jgi:hypothetical protein
MWKEAVMAYFKVLSQYFLGGTEENNENLSQDGQCSGPDLKPRLSEHEAGVLTT